MISNYSIEVEAERQTIYDDDFKRLEKFLYIRMDEFKVKRTLEAGRACEKAHAALIAHIDARLNATTTETPCKKN